MLRCNMKYVKITGLHETPELIQLGIFRGSVDILLGEFIFVRKKYTSILYKSKGKFTVSVNIKFIIITYIPCVLFINYSMIHVKPK